VRKVVAGLFISLDGITESPDKWQFEHFDEDMMAAMSAYIAEVDTVLLGRVTYQEWASYWPNSPDDLFAPHINNAPKHVVSTTLDDVEWGKWGNATLISGDLAEAVADLKRQPGNNIAVEGSPSLVESMLQDDLLDELTLMIHPVVAGGGKRLFKDGRALKRMWLVDSKTTATGVSILTFEPRDPR
jgi:dihydrofolate reductase